MRYGFILTHDTRHSRTLTSYHSKAVKAKAVVVTLTLTGIGGKKTQSHVTRQDTGDRSPSSHTPR